MSGRVPLSPAANADSQSLVSLYADGHKRVFATDATTVGTVLERSGVKLGPGDLVEPAVGFVVPKTKFNINVYRARPVLVQDGYRTYRLQSAYQSPRLLAQAAGLKVYPEDTLTLGVITNVVDHTAIGDKVSIKRATPLTIHADGKSRLIRTQAATVGEAIKAANVPLGLKDTVSRSLEAPIISGMEVVITRVAEADVTVNEKIARKVEIITDPTMLKGKKEVRTLGSDGEKVSRYRVHYRDGVETGRQLLEVVSETEPVTRVEVVGTKVLFAGSVEYWRPLVEAAAEQWGLDPNTMLRIMACESKGNATIVSRFIVNGEHPTGLFQYLPSTWVASGGTADNILDGAAQIRITARKMAREGTSAWACQ